MRTPDGRSRKFAFIGLRTAEEADRVRRYYDRNYIEMSRIDVQFALERGSGQLERAWSKYSKDSSRHAHQQQHTPADDERKDDSHSATAAKQSKPVKDALTSLISSVLPADKATSLTSDPLFHDYMQAMGGSKKAKFWENDDSTAGTMAAGSGAVAEGRVAVEEKERMWKMMDGATEEGEDGSEDEYENAPVIGGDEEEIKTAAAMERVEERPARADTSDAEYLKARQSKAFDSDEEEEDEAKQAEPDEAEEELEAEQQAEPTSPAQPIEVDECRLFIRNLPFTITDDDIHTHFAHYGPIQSIHIPTNGDGSGKGFAFITYFNASHAQRALDSMNERIVMGRLIHILPSQKRPTTTDATADDAGDAGKGKELTYKQQKQRALKKAASDGTTHSNTLFMRADTVMASMAERLQVEKADILNMDDKSSLAVRLALAESHLINETKDWLKQQGVNVSALERTGEADVDAKLRASLKRSDRVVLCKNIPFETEQSELRTMFGKFGTLVRVVLPPSKTLALVEYEQPAHAKKGYAALAYTKYHHVPLYLEWAPVDAFVAKPAAVPTAAAAVVPTSATVAEDVDGQSVEGNTVFVKNLSFHTTEQSLLDLFKAAAAVRSVHIATKKNSSKAIAAGGSKVLSMGYGFVELRSGEDVKALIGRMQGVQLDGHALELKPSTRSLSAAATVTGTSTATAAGGGGTAGSTSTAGTSRRLIVKNLPFEATMDEVRALFKTFGSVTRVRLPRKMDGSHRGYGFVDFTSGEEAREAMVRLGHTHLYGRPLVLQWSDEKEEGGEEGEAVEAGEERVKRQREKVRRQYEQSQSEMPAHKRSKKVIVDDEL